MLKGTAQSGSNDPPDDRYAIIVELAQLSKAISEARADDAYTAAAELSAALLRVPKAAVFVKGRELGLVTGCSVGMDGDEELIAAARGIAETSINSTSPILRANVAAKDSQLARTLSSADMASVLCMPMRVGESNVGAIVAISDVPRAYSPSDIELLHVVASQAALAAWRSGYSAPQESGAESPDDLIKLAQRQIQELSLINQVSEAVNSTLDLEKLLDISLEQSMMSIGADAGSMMLINEDTGRMEIVASRGIAHKWVKRTSQQVGTSIAGWVAKHGESVLVTNAHEDPRFQMKAFRDSISSAASVPLRTKSGTLGVLNVNTTKAGKLFNERDLEILGTIANQMAVAIENARLYARVNRRTKQLGSLLQISKTITSTLNLDEVMHRLSNEISQLFGLDVCVLLLLDDLSDRFRFGYGSGLRTRQKYKYYDLSAPLAANVKKTGRRLMLRSINSSAAFATGVSKSEALEAAIALPLKDSGKLVGVAVGFTREARAFPKSQRDIMKPLGELAGVAIRNARVYRQKYKIAELLKQRLIPYAVPEVEGLQIGHKCIPSREVGGDYYDFLTSTPGHIGIAVGDVSGSDVEAAEYTTMGKHVLRAYARECESPGQVLTRTNDLVCEDTSAELFISLFYGLFDVQNKKLRYSNAGCEPAILYKARDASACVLSADGILLGIRRGMLYEEREIDMEPGDILVIYTDGLVEAGVDGNRFGRESVIQILTANASRSAPEITDLLHDSLLEFVHGRIPDDTTFVVLKTL